MGKSLKQFWRPYYDACLQNEDVIISLASSELNKFFLLKFKREW